MIVVHLQHFRKVVLSSHFHGDGAQACLKSYILGAVFRELRAQWLRPLLPWKRLVFGQ